MAATITNWVSEKGTVTERDIKALEYAKQVEKKDTKKGYRYIRVSPRISVHVPCDKDGKPTEEGRRRIQLLLDSKGGVV